MTTPNDGNGSGPADASAAGTSTDAKTTTDSGKGADAGGGAKATGGAAGDTGKGSTSADSGTSEGARPGGPKIGEPITKGSQMRATVEPNWKDQIGAPRGGNWSREGDGLVKGLWRGQWHAGMHWMEKLGGKIPGGTLAKIGGKSLAKAVPGLGTLVAGGFLIKDLSDREWGKAALDAVSMIPFVGWIGVAGSAIWDIADGVSDSASTGTGNVWEAPDGATLFVLPASAADNAAAVSVDGELRKQQNELFGFQDGPTGTVWTSNPPDALRLDGPEVKAALNGWLKGLADQFQQIDATLTQSGEPYAQMWREKLQPHLKAMAELPTHAAPIMAQLTAASDAAGGLYDSWLAANKSARTQLAQDGTLNDSAAARQLESAAKDTQSKIDTANQKLSSMLGEKSLATPIPTPRQLPVHNAPVTPAPAPVAPLPPMPSLPPPAVTPAPAPAPAPEKEKDKGAFDDINKLLTQLRSTPAPAAPQIPMPAMPHMPMAGGMPQMPMTPPAAAKPVVDQPKPRLAQERQDRPNLSGTPAENKIVPAAKVEDKPADGKTPEKPTDKPVAPGAAAAAVPPVGQATPDKPGVKPTANKPPADHTVDVKGTKVEFPNEKRAELARELASGGPGHPVSLADAATKAGLVAPVPGQDPGQQVSPADAKPGDLLRAGDKDYLLLQSGDHAKFLDFASGRVIGSDQIPGNLGSGGGYFELRDAAAGGASAAGGDPGAVSPPPQNTTTFAVDQTVKVPESGPAPTPAATPPPVPGGVTSTGSPGVPSPGTGGPANAAATDTGRGSPAVPTVGSKPLDPAAVKGNR